MGFVDRKSELLSYLSFKKSLENVSLSVGAAQETMFRLYLTEQSICHSLLHINDVMKSDQK